MEKYKNETVSESSTQGHMFKTKSTHSVEVSQLEHPSYKHRGIPINIFSKSGRVRELSSVRKALVPQNL